MSQDRTDIQSPAPIGGGILSLSDDSYVRMTHRVLLATPLEHLISGVDEDPASVSMRDCAVSPIGGYTEWTTRTSPALSVGWDWQLDAARGQAHCVRQNAPRSNIMLIDAQGRDLGAAETAALLASVIDERSWQPEVLTFITARYV